jgi:YaiO family outer membrane protein
MIRAAQAARRVIASLIAALLAAGLMGGAAASPASAEYGPPASTDAPPAAATPADERKPPVNSVFGYGAVSFVEQGGQNRTWSLIGGGVAVNASASGVTTFEAQRTARPGLENLRASIRHDENLSKATSAYVQVSASSGDPLREEWGIGGGIVQRVHPQLQLTLDARQARYATLDPAAARRRFDVIAITPGVVVSPRGTPLEVSAQAIFLRNERKDWQAGGALRAMFYTGDRDFFIAGASRYPENELGVVRQLTSVYAGMRRDIGGGLGIRITAEQARLERAWTARTLTIAIEKRF